MILDDIKKLLFPTKKSSQSVCVHATLEGIALAQVEIKKESKPRLTICEYANAAPFEQPGLLRDWVTQHELEGAVCTFIINPGEYRVLQIDAPKVPENEMRTALYWIVKDLIDIPIDQAVFDYIEIPETYTRGMKKICVFAATLDRIKEIEQQVKQAGLNLDAIDIPETTLRCLTHLLPDSDKQDIAVMYVTPLHNLITLFGKRHLILSRSQDLAAEPAHLGLEEQPQPFEQRVFLDSQRTLDYFAAQILRKPPDKLYLMPVLESLRPVQQQLTQLLTIPFETLNFETLFETSGSLSEVTLTPASLAICGALNQQEWVT